MGMWQADSPGCDVLWQNKLEPTNGAKAKQPPSTVSLSTKARA